MTGEQGRSPIADVVILARNAAGSLADVLRRVPTRHVRSIVVVDYGSQDNTASIAQDGGAIVLRESKGGEGKALLRAVEHQVALPRPSDVMVIMRGDGVDDPEQIPALLAPIIAGEAELVLGDPGRGQSGPAGALGRSVAVGMIGVIYRRRFESLGRFRAVRFPALVALGLSDHGTGWAAEMQVKAVRLGLRIAEVPVASGTGAVDGSPVRRAYERIGESSRVLFHILRHSTAR